VLTVAGARRMMSVLPGFLALATHAGVEIDGPGYRRQPVGPWTSNDGYVFNAPPVKFGPARYDAWPEVRSAVLVDGDGWDPVEVASIDAYVAADGATLIVQPLVTVRR
jgi:hypothetical protein